MERDIEIKEERCTIPVQVFNGKKYYLYEGERYFSKGSTRLHTEVWKYYKGDIPKGYHVHHVDGNTSNNDISNLNLILASLHLRYEGKKRFKNNPEWAKDFHAKGIEKAKEWHASEEGREWHRKHAEKFDFGNKTYGEKKCIVCESIFTSKTNGQKFCSNKCKSKYRRESGVDNIEKICIKCGKVFIGGKYLKTKTCSNSCGNSRPRASL
jgi:predicted nucleic acid-binding Zn ribbon protein